MFKRITFLFVLGLAGLSANAQFKIEEDTLHAYGYAGKTSAEFVDISTETHIYFLGSTPERIKWVRSTNDLPDPEWTSAVCDIESCKSAETDTGSFMFFPEDSGKLSFHFYTKNVNNSGKMVVRFFRASNPLDFEEVVIFATAWKPVGIDMISTSVTSAVPNPSQGLVRLNNSMIENGKLEMFNLNGQLVFSMDYSNNMEIQMNDFAPGIYTIRISDASNISCSRIIKE
jgi:hypothetical protein